MRKKGDMPLTTEEIAKIKQLAGLGYSDRRIGAELGRSDHSVHRVLTASADVVGEVQTIKANLADSFQGLAERMVSAVSDEDIGKLDAYKKTLSAAIACDKAQLLKGLPTENVNIRVLLDVAALIRARRTKQYEDEDLDTIPVSPVRILPAPSAEPVPEAIPAPAPSHKRALEPPASALKVRYYTPVPLERDSSEDDPLMRGLRTR